MNDRRHAIEKLEIGKHDAAGFSPVIEIEIFSSPGCGKCSHAKAALQAVIEKLGTHAVQWREVNILEELDYAVTLGVLSTPAIAIDGKLIFTTLPSAKALERALMQRLLDTSA